MVSAWLGARELSIEWADNPDHWTWNYIYNSGMEVAELLSVCWLDIRGKIDTRRLTRKTSYSAYLVFKLTDNASELERAIASVRFVKEKAEGTDEEGYTVFLSKRKEEGENGIFPHLRSDEYMEIKLGEFFNNLGEEGEVEMRLMENKNPNWKSGIIVKGIDIRPN
ncbi:putative F-box protein PP2-B12 isoform X1 [Lycium barbarum]|uniref:putative F-box protein PP2-B12 isoform X1 n=1 Tax=Lycium barbarum TaxID=112863 RepID=UPI00293F1C30|nr:putative F-box protein PP2-B12 isoform X1 [Lycium barbarum]